MFDANHRMKANHGVPVDMMDINVEIRIDENLTRAIYSGPVHLILLSILLPTLQLATAIWCGWLLFQWRRKQGSFFAIPLSARAVLITEGLTLFVLSITLFVQGWFSRYTSDAGSVWSLFLVTQFSGLSVSTTVITGVFWRDIAMKMKSLRPKATEGVALNVVMVSLVLGALLDVASLTAVYDFENTEIVTMAIATIGYVICGTFFVVQIYKARRYMKRNSANASKATKKLFHRVEIISRWLLANAVCIAITILSTIILGGVGLVFYAETSTASWAVVLYSRVAVSISQVGSLQPPARATNRKSSSSRLVTATSSIVGTASVDAGSTLELDKKSGSIQKRSSIFDYESRRATVTYEDDEDDNGESEMGFSGSSEGQADAKELENEVIVPAAEQENVETDAKEQVDVARGGDSSDALND